MHGFGVPFSCGFLTLTTCVSLPICKGYVRRRLPIRTSKPGAERDGFLSRGVSMLNGTGPYRMPGAAGSGEMRHLPFQSSARALKAWTKDLLLSDCILTFVTLVL